MQLFAFAESAALCYTEKKEGGPDMRCTDWLLELLYPSKCMCCRKILDGGGAICPACADKLTYLDRPVPGVRGAARCEAVLCYEGDFREAFHRFKFGGMRRYAEDFGRWMARCVQDRLAGSYDLITWTPVSERRRRERGYDQAELLCRVMARELSMKPVRTLRKLRHTQAQSGLSGRSARLGNVLGVYEAVEPENFAGLRVLLVDDVVTTGATLSEASRTLLSAGAGRVVCMTLAAAVGTA